MPKETKKVRVTTTQTMKKEFIVEVPIETEVGEDVDFNFDLFITHISYQSYTIIYIAWFMFNRLNIKKHQKMVF